VKDGNHGHFIEYLSSDPNGTYLTQLKHKEHNKLLLTKLSEAMLSFLLG
jgi:hypothetical protein